MAVREARPALPFTCPALRLQPSILPSPVLPPARAPWTTHLPSFPDLLSFLPIDLYSSLHHLPCFGVYISSPMSPVFCLASFARLGSSHLPPTTHIPGLPHSPPSPDPAHPLGFRIDSQDGRILTPSLIFWFFAFCFYIRSLLPSNP